MAVLPRSNISGLSTIFFLQHVPYLSQPWIQNIILEERQFHQIPQCHLFKFVSQKTKQKYKKDFISF